MLHLTNYCVILENCALASFSGLFFSDCPYAILQRLFNEIKQNNIYVQDNCIYLINDEM